jgi:hypothetical protein
MAKTSPVIETVDHIHKAIDSWLQKNTEERLTERVHHLLDENQKKIVLTLLGFENRWGGWEIDHCNGRSGNTPVGEYISQTHEEAIKEWLSQVKLPTMTPTIKKQITQEMERHYQSEVRRRMHDVVVAKAQADVDTLMETINVDEFLVSLKKVRKLVTPQE